MAFGIGLGVFVSLLTGAIVGQLVVHKNEAGIFPGLMAGIWVTWAFLYHGKERRCNFLHPVPRCYRVPLKQAFNKVRTVIADRVYDYGDRWKVLSADAQTRKKVLSTDAQTGKKVLSTDAQTGRKVLSTDAQIGRKVLSTDAQTGRKVLSADAQTGRKVLSTDAQIGKKVLSADAQTRKKVLSADTQTSSKALNADTQTRKIHAVLQLSVEETKDEAGAEGQSNSYEQREQHLLEMDVQFKEESNGTTIVQFDFHPKVEGLAYEACEPIVAGLISDVQTTLGPGTNAGNSMATNLAAPPWWLLGMTGLALLLLWSDVMATVFKR